MAGCYEALDGGSTAEAIVDFTGAVTESINLIDGNYDYSIIEQVKLFRELLKVHKRGGLISCYIMVSAQRASCDVSFGLSLIPYQTVSPIR